jgi:periplasmic protein TonB
MLGPIVLTILVANPFSALPLAGPTSSNQQPPASAGQTGPDQPWPPAGVFRPGAGVTAPRLTKEVRPRYPNEAMRAKIQGAVLLEAVVQTDGTVGEVRVTRSLDQKFGLDDACISAVKKWQFTPGTKDGVAVPVLVEVEMTLRTKS